jgi:hypothetical protein
MSVSLELNTPLADALSNVVQPKLVEVGWSTGGLDDSALSEYIILMLVNGKTQEQIAAELSNDLLSLSPDDSGALDFAKWLWDQVETLNRQLNGNSIPPTGPMAQPIQTQAIPSFTSPENARSSRRGSKQSGVSGGQDAEMSDAMDGVQNGSMYAVTIFPLLHEFYKHTDFPQSYRAEVYAEWRETGKQTADRAAIKSDGEIE